MKYLKSKEDSLKIWLSLFLLAGSLAGTWFCNQMTNQMKHELLILGQSSVTSTALAQVDRYDLLLRILPSRIWMLIIVMLAAATPAADWCMRFVAGYIGFSHAVLICAVTMEHGAGGFLRYMMLQFPQCICYIPVGYLLLWWLPAKEKRLTLLSILFLTILVCLGSLAESFVNPWILMWF